MTLAIGAILLGLAVPSLQGLMSGSQLSATTNTLVYSLQTARSEAIKRGTTVGVCTSNTPLAANATCDSGAGYDSGWIVFVDGDDSGTREAAEEIVLSVEERGPAFTLDRRCRIRRCDVLQRLRLQRERRRNSAFGSHPDRLCRHQRAASCERRGERTHQLGKPPDMHCARKSRRRSYPVVDRVGGDELRHRSQRGLGIIEVLVALVVVSFGVLGMASLQLTGMKHSSSGFNRSKALLFAENMATRMRINDAGVAATELQRLRFQHDRVHRATQSVLSGYRWRWCGAIV